MYVLWVAGVLERLFTWALALDYAIQCTWPTWQGSAARTDPFKTEAALTKLIRWQLRGQGGKRQAVSTTLLQPCVLFQRRSYLPSATLVYVMLQIMISARSCRCLLIMLRDRCFLALSLSLRCLMAPSPHNDIVLALFDLAQLAFLAPCSQKKRKERKKRMN